MQDLQVLHLQEGVPLLAPQVLLDLEVAPVTDLGHQARAIAAETCPLTLMVEDTEKTTTTTTREGDLKRILRKGILTRGEEVLMIILEEEILTLEGRVIEVLQDLEVLIIISVDSSNSYIRISSKKFRNFYKL